MQDYQDDPDTDVADDADTLDAFDRLWEFLKAVGKSFLAALERL